eukprot:gene16733-19082_t
MAMAMDIFLSIPEEIAKQIVVEWLKIFHVAKLDSAYLSHNSHDSTLLTKFFHICGSSIKEITLQDFSPKRNLAYDVKGDCNANLPFFALRTFVSFDAELSDNFLAAIAVGSPHLEEIDLNRASNVSTRGFDEIAANCPLLQDVRLWYMDTYDVHVLPIVRSCKNLHTLEIVEPGEFFTDVSLTAIAECCPALHTLCLRECAGITDKGVDKVLKSCTKLRDLSLDGTSLMISRMVLTDETLHSIAKHCPLLTSLGIADGYYYSESGLAAVAKGCTRLQHVVFSASGGLTQGSADLFSDQVKVVCGEGSNDFVDEEMYAPSDDDST